MKQKECFIVMPFGIKPFADGSGRKYDFDKVYRVLIQRAVRDAELVPIRADERVGSALIHSDMFRDLRDRSVVLADLSLDNPNVFYELGVRHVMSSRGTVLMCRKGSQLPFDVKLSRVVFYDFDGGSLDWEEVEEVVKRLTVSLLEAKKGLPDSPVHALLETVMREEGLPEEQSIQKKREERADGEPLATYQALVAQWWRSQGESAEDLLKEHHGSVFGSRAVARFCLSEEPLPPVAKQVANHLNDGQQFRLANKLYSRLYEAGKLTRGSQLAYASSYSEEHEDIKGADHAIGLVKEALEAVRTEFSETPESSEAILSYAKCYRRLAGLLQWRWQISQANSDLNDALAAFADATRYNDRARALGVMRHPGFIAQSRLKELLLLRIRDESVDRPDVEGHRDAVVALKPESKDFPVGISYLGWFQAITLADMGASDSSNRKALETRIYDAELKSNPEYWEIGGRQYSHLRRFLEQYSESLRNQSLIGHISQVLQAGESNR